MRRALVSTGAVVIAVAASPVAAQAALFLTFSTTRASPGDVVHVRTGGTGALTNIPADSPPLRVLLARAEEADAITSPTDRRLVGVGHLRVDERGDDSLRFVVPDLQPGTYTTFVHCVPCAPSSAGRTLVPTGPFPGPFVILAAPGHGSRIRFAAVAAGGTVVLLAAVWAAARRRGTG